MHEGLIFQEKLIRRLEYDIEILKYESRHQSRFKALNLEWLDKYDLTESHDLMVLDDPEGTILDQGGYIWLAACENEIIGTAALIKGGEGIFELAKMSVTEKWQGRGVGKVLLETCLSQARGIGAKRLTLFSNHQLSRALALYERYGFKKTELKDSPFDTADVRMELEL